MNSIRLAIIFTLQLWFQLINKNPINESNFVEIVDLHPGQYFRFIIYNIIMNILSCMHLLTDYNVPLSFPEWIPIIVAGLAFGLRMWSYYSLGQYFTATLGIKKDHELIQNGPYQYLVHPSYTGQGVFMMMGLLFFRAYYLSIVFLIYISYTYRKNMLAEESMLMNKFGDTYVKYLSTRYRLLPFIF
jgi:protein-S-isoprenylcysteine O-methyltransferase Ste14